jgi:hypothetical protein
LTAFYNPDGKCLLRGTYWIQVVHMLTGVLQRVRWVSVLYRFYVAFAVCLVFKSLPSVVGILCKWYGFDCAVKVDILSSWCTVLCVVQEFQKTVDAVAADFLTFQPRRPARTFSLLLYLSPASKDCSCCRMVVMKHFTVISFISFLVESDIKIQSELPGQSSKNWINFSRPRGCVFSRLNLYSCDWNEISLVPLLSRPLSLSLSLPVC